MSKIKTLIVLLTLAVVAVVLLIVILRPKPPMSQTYSFSPVLSLSPFDVVDGNLYTAKLPIIIYENYLDHFSKNLQASLQEAKKDFNNLVFIYRPFVNRYDQKSLEMALLLACSNEQNKGNDLRESLFQLEENFILSDDLIAKHQLNQGELEECLNDAHLKESLLQLTDDARANSIFGSPSLMVGSELVLGARPYQDFIDSSGDKVEGLYSVIARQLDMN